MPVNKEMNMLRKIQRDLHKQNVLQSNMNEKLSCMEGKLDQQQSTIKRLEEQVRNNNTPGNNNIHDETDIGDESGIGDINMEIDETSFQEKTILKESGTKGNENDNYIVTEELIRLLSRVLIRNIRVLENVHIKFKQMVSELTQIKAHSKKVEETATAVQNQDTSMMLVGTHRINQLKDELKLMMSEISKMKRAIEDIGEQCKKTDELSTTCTAVETIQIPSYSPAEQIRDLINNELKRIIENCEAANIFPNIEIVLDPNTEYHPIMKALQQGIFCVRHVPGILCVNPTDENNICDPHYTTRTIYLDTPGLKKHKVMKLLKAKPNMTLYEVLKNRLNNTDLWHRLKSCNFYVPACPTPTWTCNNI